MRIFILNGSDFKLDGHPSCTYVHGPLMASGSVQSVCTVCQRCTQPHCHVTWWQGTNEHGLQVQVKKVQRPTHFQSSKRVRNAQFSECRNMAYVGESQPPKKPCPASASASTFSNLQTWRLSWFIHHSYQVFQSEGRKQVHYRGEEDKGISSVCGPWERDQEVIDEWPPQVGLTFM